ncbi:haloacid dehalogenase type II [Arthrobacter sp. Soc17.1.1.1]|uniref:haloacid dehalogenase type II n=1 Tax=Arthrobacter sp. Soc17.1.1.1 TaxID=3121277 RepID=UPI002FE45AD8
MVLPVVLFDVNGTLSDMEPLSRQFEEIGAPPQLAALWFTSVLRDGFALTATGQNPAFKEVAEGSLRAVLADGILDRDLDDAVAHIMSALQGLAVHQDVVEGIRALASDGFGVAVLTNGAMATAEALLDRAGVRDQVSAVLSVEDAPRWKPAPESYAYALGALQREAGDVVLVAVHPWDIEGAARAGLRTAWLNRDGSPYPSAMSAPDHEVSAITDLPGVLQV